uniref:Caveolin n=1 Tax=Sinocyclocheilus grahami TaxID=75366 RepID=A0A672Q6D3_SINGR
VSTQETFEDVTARPASVRSFDKVFRLWFYRIVSLLLAVPVALVAGLLFAVLSCLHIWLLVPSVQILVINLHWIKVVWHNVICLEKYEPHFRTKKKSALKGKGILKMTSCTSYTSKGLFSFI